MRKKMLMGAFSFRVWLIQTPAWKIAMFLSIALSASVVVYFVLWFSLTDICDLGCCFGEGSN